MSRIGVLALAAAALGAPVFAQTPANPDPMAAMESMEPMDHWMTMLHANAFLSANRQGGGSGGRDFESQNHFMARAIRAVGGGKLTLRGTFTLEPATIPAEGSPQLFQRGETYHGILLIDRQHPHDLFVELAAEWERSLGRGFRLRVLAGPLGEPALGPMAYPHRLSASENPSAPLSHHNQDSTHIAADVVTAGLFSSVASLEASAFHGREPDENRWNIDQGRIDSYSARVTLMPAAGLSVQVSAGRLHHPESIEPGNQTRSTCSVSYTRATANGFVAATLAAGRNATPDGPEWGNLLEATWKFGGANDLYARMESVDRDLYELLQKRQRPAGVAPRRTAVQAATLGAVRDLPLLEEAETGIGADVTAYRFSSRLRTAYGSHPLSVHAFLRIRFGSHGGESMPAHGHS